MSSHPFGLVDDPFAAGYELSLEETRLLIQNRISTCGANGAQLFPPETCAEIHRRSRGTASASLKLAQHAMLRAAKEGAPAVAPAHVHPEAAEAPVAAKAPSLPSSPAPARPETKAAVPSSAAPRPTPPVPLSREVWATHPSPVPATARERVSWTATAAVFLLFFGGAAVLILFMHPAGPTLLSFARTSAPQGAIVPEAPPQLADDSVLAILRAPSVASAPAPATSIPAPARKAAAARTTAAASRTAVPVRAESSRNEAPKLGLEVARYIVKDRARAERRRLAATGHPVRVLTGWEGGAQVFRVVLGSFSSQGEAERVADQLLAKGSVSQAMVVTLK